MVEFFGEEARAVLSGVRDRVREWMCGKVRNQGVVLFAPAFECFVQHLCNGS